MLATKENVTVKRRSKGEQTRNNILIAAIDILAHNGIKGTTHRAIANHANIQLSLTTYYFKDIQELVHQAFKLNSEHITQLTDFAWKQAFDYLDAIGKTQLKKVSVKKQVREQLSQLATEYIINKVTEMPIALAVEQLLFTEIQTTPQLRELADQHRNLLLGPFVKLCQYFDQENTKLDADILFTIFTQIEYRNIMLPVDQIDRAAIYEQVNRVVGWIMKLK
ncbi:TetR/AcrR family transcriptional regulator [Thalassotalea piscium]|uniref:DNA-binding transcriptional regulator YbjK n=1 Tax=Thalassotalea piscium TaxID=1230533 RepID=A0A7X0TST4_9GAMM|nr:TetR family transcriptional regulator [Thalassotalea piscium]MBB6542473.1 DNA-binding transcriptional regulator YbjK [Thalassotalea piscium]